MKWIRKGKEPKDLQEHRGIKGTDYESFKTDVGLGDIAPATGLRKSLMDDQGYICAYCMKRIPHGHLEKGVKADKMKIEHYIAQTKPVSIKDKLDITYSNMLACCTGNHGQREQFETCDTKKGDSDLTISPLNEAHIRTLNYGPDGSIHSLEELFENEINQVLNLNEDNLKKQREAIYKLTEKRVREVFSKPKMTRDEKNTYIEKQIEWWNSRKDGKFS